jgi:hypothetical protein
MVCFPSVSFTPYIHVKCFANIRATYPASLISPGLDHPTII